MPYPVAAVRGNKITTAPAAASGGWWDDNGAISGCVAAYQAIGADDLAASYVNLANPGTNNAAPGTAPTWSAVDGWTFNGSTQYLITGLTPANTWSVLCRFSGHDGLGDRYLFGTYDTTGPKLWAITPGSSSNRIYWVGAVANRLVVAGSQAAGVIGMAGGGCYLNGASDGTVTPGTLPAWSLYIGARNKSNGTPDAFWADQIQAFAVYNVTLDGTDMTTISTAMAAL